MKNIYYILLVLLMLGSYSCSDFLDKAPNAEMPEEEVFRDPEKFKRFQSDIYAFLNGSKFGTNRQQEWGCWMYGGLGRVQGGSFDGITDLARSTEPRSYTVKWTQGDWGISPGLRQDIVLPYTEGYRAIRKCNQVIAYIDNVEGLTERERNQYLGESYFLRGFFFFEMIRRYGGVPYVDRILEISEDMDLPRDSYDVCVEKICQDFDKAAELLPLEMSDSDLGRATLGAALAYKARTLLYGASPMDNPSNDVEKWKKAAAAAYDVISLNFYKLNSMKDWPNMFFGNQDQERIFQRLESAKRFEENTRYGWTPPSMVNGAPGLGTHESGTTAPTQNFVDMFEMADGSVPIVTGKNYNGLNPVINPESGYSDDKMYENRDPRFYYTVVHNGMMQWFNPQQTPAPMELWGDYTTPGNPVGKHISDTRANTGYLNRKMWPPQFYAGSQEQVYQPWIFFRYAEILLIYAEAMNEAFGPDTDGLGFGLTARQALNQVRNRDLTGAERRDVKVATGDKEGLRERIMNENAVEFFLEEHRYWDVRRWKQGVELFNKPVYRAIITVQADGSMKVKRDKLEDRVFRDYMHRYPIPVEEVEKSDNLEQNPGWEVKQ